MRIPRPARPLTVLFSLAAFISAHPHGLSAASVSGKIVFVRDDGQVWISSAAEGVPRRLTSDAEACYPRLSPSGAEIAFTTARDGIGEIDIMNADGSSRRTLVKQGIHAAWSPDGREIAFKNDRGIWVVGRDGLRPRLLSDHGGFPSWSPDGRKLAFSSSKGGKSRDLWVMNADGSDQHRLFSTGRQNLDVAWSPKGLDGTSKIAFAGDVGSAYSYDVFLISPDGGGPPVRLTRNLKQDFEPAWSPDGSHLAFVSFEKGEGIYLLDLQGRQSFFTRGRQPSWGP